MSPHSPSKPVFFDARGWRKWLLVFLATLAVSALALVLAAFAWSLFHTGEFRLFVPTKSAASAGSGAGAAVPAVPATREGTMSIVAAFYAPWQESGLTIFRAHAQKLTHVMPEWIHLGADGATLEFESADDPRTLSRDLDLQRAAQQNGVAVHAVINNVTENGFDPERLHALLTSREKQVRVSEALRDWLLDRGCQGLNLDFENFAAADRPKLPAFIDVLAGTLHAAGLELSIDVEIELDDSELLKRLAASCDFIVLMAYDEHADSDDPGPIASQPWFVQVLSRVRRQIPADKLVIGMGNYGYDWTAGRKPAESITTHDALVRATTFAGGARPEEVIRFDPVSLNPTFRYLDEKGGSHEVWFLDAVTAANQWRLLREAGVRGSALWLLGSEDESIWTFYDRKLPAPPQAAGTSLQRMSVTTDFDFSGEGEILSVASDSREGWREMEWDTRRGLFRNEIYHRIPTPLVIQRSHRAERLLALTFDDGPNPRFTPQILDTLDRLDVPASFFVLGAQAAQNPELIERIWRRGDDIGNHTFSHPNMEKMDEKRAIIEMNSTRRLLQGLIGHSTTLFRPPFRVDADITTMEAARTVVFAGRQQCVTVAADIDPHDWDPYKTQGEMPLLRTSEDIAHDVIEQAHATGGNVILLHDGGGNRRATAGALDLFVPALRAEGYRFVTISQLAGKSRETSMPPVSQAEAPLVRLDRTIISTSFGLFAAVKWLFVGAITLGMVRIVIITGLAIFASRRKPPVPSPDFRPVVTALIPAYNEATVIVRTVESLLRGGEEVDEILVIDDGSTDGTAALVEREFADVPAVRVLRQRNSGKSAALNHGVAEAAGEVLICCDADTQFAPGAVGRLVRHFADPQVGAVAGNVKVGNRVNVLTRWQSLEYITSQNLDRLAYSVGDAITVVPGAIGAWRRSAVRAVQGYTADTHAEDTDLTWRLHRAGWRIRTEQGAIAHTEAPERLGALLKQRFRWTFGTLQCLWKHRGALGRHGWFGRAVLPSIWLFNVAFQLVAPLVDIQVFVAVLFATRSWWQQHFHVAEWQPDLVSSEFLSVTVASLAVFFTVDLIAAYIGLRLDRESPRALTSLFWQRFTCRQLLYCVLLWALVKAAFGTRTGWGKLERTGSLAPAFAEPSLATAPAGVEAVEAEPAS